MIVLGGAFGSPGAVPALMASWIALGSPALVGWPVIALVVTSSMPGATRNGVGGLVGERGLHEIAEDRSRR